MERKGSNGSTELAGVGLSPGEYRVFIMRVRGFSLGAIAEELGVSCSTVDSYLNRISHKVREVFPDFPVRKTTTRMAIEAVVRGHVAYEGLPNDLRLSGREMELVPLILMGQDNGEIADLLVLSVGTVIDQVSNIDRKLGLNMRDNGKHYLARSGRLAYAGLRQIRNGGRPIV